jgi:hypothetical protein
VRWWGEALASARPPAGQGGEWGLTDGLRQWWDGKVGGAAELPQRQRVSGVIGGNGKHLQVGGKKGGEAWIQLRGGRARGGAH